MKLYLIRHGQTQWNKLRKIQGHHDIMLNEEGQHQARMLAAGMADRPVARIYSSGLKRAQETAQAIATQQQVQVTVLEALKEVDFGEWEGMTYAEIKAKDPDRYQRWRINPVVASPPGGENQTQIFKRCKTVIETILSEATTDVAIVSHGAMLAHLVAFLLPNEEAADIIVENASITTLNYHPLTNDFVLLEANNTRHLY